MPPKKKATGAAGLFSCCSSTVAEPEPAAAASTNVAQTAAAAESTTTKAPVQDSKPETKEDKPTIAAVPYSKYTTVSKVTHPNNVRLTLLSTEI